MIVVAGEALVDLIVSPSGEVEARPGGGPFNVARTIGRLGVPVTFLGRLSDDRFGRQLRRLLADDGVGLACPAPVDAPTTLAVAELDDGGQAQYRFYVTGTSAGALAVEDVPAGPLNRPPAAFHVGTLGLVMDPIASTLEGVVAGLDPDVLVMVDPNCRPVIIRDEVEYRERLHRILRRADVVKVSREDLAFLEPGLNWRLAAERIAGLGPRVVLVTDGAASVVASVDGDEIRVPVPSVEVADTVGAGDAFGGAFLAWWWRSGLRREDFGDHQAIQAAVEAAVEVAAITCERPGAMPPRLAELVSRGRPWPPLAA